MNLLIDIWATGDGAMKVYYSYSGGKRISRCGIHKSWLSVVSRFKNFARKDKTRIERFYNELKTIYENN